MGITCQLESSMLPVSCAREIKMPGMSPVGTPTPLPPYRLPLPHPHPHPTLALTLTRASTPDSSPKKRLVKL